MQSKSKFKDQRNFPTTGDSIIVEKASNKRYSEASKAGNGKPLDKKNPVSKLTVVEPAILIDFLITSLKDQSRTTVKSLLSHQQITIANKVVKQFDYELKPRDVVCVSWGKGKETLDTPLLKIIFEDKHLIVVDKAAGLLSIATQK